MERVENMNGGYLVTAMTAAVTYASGLLLNVTGWLGGVWSQITPGQAALIIGALTYLTHNGPKFVGLARRLVARLRKGASHVVS